MSIVHTITRSYKDQSPNALTLVETVTDAYERNFDQSVPIATNTLYNVSLIQAKLKSVCMKSDQAVTIKTNSPGSPQETINLVAGQAYIWTLQTDGAGKIPFAGDVTAMYITNASGSAANFSLRAIESN